MKLAFYSDLRQTKYFLSFSSPPASIGWPVLSLEEEGSGALAVRELFWWNAVTAYLLVRNARGGAFTTAMTLWYAEA